eukprot:jgi/Chlat1/3115/Chrsp21S03392
MARAAAVWSCGPATQRGRPAQLDAHAASNTLLYVCGRTAVLLPLPTTAPTTTARTHAPAHAAPLTVARLSPNGEWAATADALGNVKVWGVINEDHPVKLECRPLSGPDGQRIVVCGENAPGGKGPLVKCFMWDSGNSVGEFDGHSKSVRSCDFRPTRPFRIATGGEDGCANMYAGPPFRFSGRLIPPDSAATTSTSTSTSTTINNSNNNNPAINCVRFSPDGSLLAVAGADGRVRIHNATTGDHTTNIHTDTSSPVYAISWMPSRPPTSSTMLAGACADGSVRVWELSRTGEGGEKVVLEGKEVGRGEVGAGIGDMQVGCVWVRDPLLVSLSLCGDINHFNPTSLSHAPNTNPAVLHPTTLHRGHAKAITALAVSPNAVFSASWDGAIANWSACPHNEHAFGTLIHFIRREGPKVYALAVGHDGCVHACTVDDKMHVFGKGEEQGRSACVSVGSGPIGLCAAGRLVACAVSDGTVTIRVAKAADGGAGGDGDVVVWRSGLKITAIALSPDASELALGTDSGTLHTFSLPSSLLSSSSSPFSPPPLHSLSARHRAAVTCAAYCPSRAMMASGDAGREVVVWRCDTGEALPVKLVHHTARVTCLAWSPSGSTLATGSLDASVIVWDVGDTTTAVKKKDVLRNAHEGGVAAVGFLKEDLIVSGGQDACLKTWHVDV